MKLKIVFLDEATVTLDDVDFSQLKALGDYAAYPNSTGGQIVERARTADVIIVNKVPMTADVINSLDRLKLITVIATGYNNVDVEAAKAHGIRVCNVAGYARLCVPQHTFALLLNLATKACAYHNDVMAGAWQKATSFNLLTYKTFELAGKTIGIVGFGAIGRGVARIAEAFGMNVLVNDRYPVKDAAYDNTDLESLLRRSDIVTLHCPLTEETRNLIDRAALEKMKPGAIIINTARGGIVDEKALAEMLNSGRLGGAGFDVLTEEPPRDNVLLRGVKNLLVTPHSAWATVEARQRLIDETAENIRAFLRGEARNVVA